MNITYNVNHHKSHDEEEIKSISVRRYVCRELEANYGETLENAQANAEYALDAIGMLVEILADKGILNLEEILKIAGRDSICPSNKPEQENHKLSS